MPVIDAKNYLSKYDAVSTKLVKQEKRDSKISTNAFSSNDSTRFKKITNKSKSPTPPPKKDKQNVNPGQSGNNSPARGKLDSKIEVKRNSSIVSGSRKLQELQELHKELSKSSYYDSSKSLEFKPRKPTLESIKTAIGKAKLKQLEMASNKSVGTEDEKRAIVTAEASTSTNQSKTKKKKKKVKGSADKDDEKKKKKKKTNVDVKLKTKIKVNKEK